MSQKPWEPTPRREEWWTKRHQKILNITATSASDIKVVFIGSSIIDFWGATVQDLWDAKYEPMGAVNYGIRADRTEHVLWRIENGELDGLSPELVVIYIGSNNVPLFTVEETVRGVEAVVDKLHAKLPNANLLFVAFFPRADVTDIKGILTKIRSITETLKPILDENKEWKSHFLDIFWSFAPPSIDYIYEEYYLEDKIHLNRDGYTIWDNLMNSTLYSLLQNTDENTSTKSSEL